MSSKLAHSLDSKTRTRDVLLVESISFESLLLPETILKGLAHHGFQKPSPIQVKALPIGRCGFDLMVKSKSGTGKTLVFGIISLETLKIYKDGMQVLILAPTREIAVQIHDVLTNIGKYFEGLKVQSFIGGFPITSDINKCGSCNIAVGTPGRIKQLIQEGHLNTSSVRLFVLDEADKLMEKHFQNDINEIYNSLPNKKQVIMCSATYPNDLEKFLGDYMLSPTLVSSEIETPLLLGLKQFVIILKSPPNIVQQTKMKNEELLKILSNISFTQCLVFSNYQTRAESISNFLNRNGWVSMFISGAQNQVERLNALSSLKDFKCRVLISTDLTARGIDAASVDLVINYDVPTDAMTYLHRMGRAGRYGSNGNCINLAIFGPELKLLQNILGIIGGQTLSMPILDDTLNLEKSIDSKENLLFAEVPENIQDFTDKCKSEISEMKNNIWKTKTKKSSGSKLKLAVSDEQQMINKVIEQNLSTSDTLSVLNQLASGTLEVNIDKKRLKRPLTHDIYKESIVSSTNSEDSDLKPKSGDINTQDESHIDPKFILKQLTNKDRSNEDWMQNIGEKKAQKMSPSDILCKNKALLSVAKILNNVDICESDNTYISEYLSGLKAREKLLVSKVFNIIEKEKKEENASLENNIPYQEFLENIFSYAYKSQTIDSSERWQNYLPENEKKKIDEYVSGNIKQNNLLNEEYNGEFEHEYIENEEYAEDYDFEMEKDIEINFSENISQEVPQNPEDYSFMKWIPVENKTNISDKKNEPLSSVKTFNCGNNHSTDCVQPYSSRVVVSSDNLHYHKQYSKYYQHCSNNLWETGLSFDSVQKFDEWFHYNWQSQMSSVRDIIQKKIYVSEMQNYEARRKGINEKLNS